MNKKKKICFAGFTDSELPGLKAAASASNPLWESHFVADAPAAVALLTESPFDAIVANMAMTGGKNGAELLHDIRDICPQTMRFIAGDVTDQSVIIDCIGGTHQFIRRPFQPATLMGALKRGLKLDNWLATAELRKLVPKLRRLPSLPSTYFNLVKEIESASATTQGIGSIISRDPVVTGRLLHMSNSAAFALAQKVTDPVHAVALLGIDTVKSLVMSLQVFSQTDVARGAGISLEILWEHSLLVAKYARQIALKQTGDQRLAGDAFTAGLLHDVGRIVLASNLPKEYSAIIDSARQNQRPLHEEETLVLKVNHAEISAYLLGMWGLPVEIVEAAGGHHSPGQTVFANEFTLLSAVHAANVFAHESGGQTDGLLLPALDEDYYKMIKLDDQLPLWREICTGEEQEDKLSVSGAPASKPEKEAAAPVAKADEKAKEEFTPVEQAPLLPPLIKPSSPILQPATRSGFPIGWAVTAAVILIAGVIAIWQFHGKSKASSESAEAPVQVAEASAPAEAPAPAPAPQPVAAVKASPVTPAPVTQVTPVAPAKASPAPATAAASSAVAAKKAPASPFDKIHVQGIFYRAASPLAIINGKTASIGDNINGFQVADIQQHSVTLSLNGEQRVFKFN